MNNFKKKFLKKENFDSIFFLLKKKIFKIRKERDKDKDKNTKVALLKEKYLNSLLNSYILTTFKFVYAFE